MGSKRFDVYAFGMVGPSRLIVLKDGWPKRDHYAEIGSIQDSIAGEAANCSIVLAALGLNVQLDGNWLSRNRAGEEALRVLRRCGIHTARLRLKDIQGPEECVIASGPSRTIFGTYGALRRGPTRWNDPRLSDLRHCRVACIDPFFKQASLAASRFAVQSHVPYTTVDGAPTDPVIQNAAVTIISGEFRRRLPRRHSVGDWFRRYQGRCRGLVVFTRGDGGILFGRREAPIRRYRPPRIHPVDTSGAGDSFRAGMTYGLLMGWEDETAIRFSAALASLNCGRSPGVLNSPALKEVLIK